MLQQTYSGSSRPSPRIFSNDARDPAGKAAWDWARVGEAKLWENIDVEAPIGFAKSRTTTYQTFITCGIKSGDELCGMLNVDAPQTGDLGEQDVEMVSALARVIAVGNALDRA